MLPTSLWANILERLGEAGEIVRAGLACKALLAATAGPFTQVHLLILRCTGPDICTQELVKRFPNIQRIVVADGCWQWTGERTLREWATTLTALQVSNTSFPLATVLLQQTQSQHQDALQAANRVADQLPQPRPGHGHSGSVGGVHQHQQQHHHQGHRLADCRSSSSSSSSRCEALVPPGLQGLTQLQLQGHVESAVKCRLHGSADCECLDFTVLAALLQQNPGLQDIDLAGNTCLPDRLLKAAVLAASCSHLRVLSLAGCEQVQPGSHLPEAFAELEHLDISNTGTTDADLQQLAAGLPHLKHLALRGCRRVSSTGINALAAGPAVVNGCLTSVDLGGLTRPNAAAISALTAALASACHTGSGSPVLLHLNLT